MIIPTSTQERLRLWTNASHKLAGWAHDMGLIMDIQNLGWVEVNLFSMEARLPAIAARQQTQPAGAEVVADDFVLNEVMALSRLWLLGLYESLRTYKSAVRGNTTAWPPFVDLDRKLNLVRAPLAKHQVAGQNTAHIPAPLLHPISGRVGWQVYDPKSRAALQVMRVELADELLAAASSLIGAGEAEARAKLKTPTPP